MSVSASICADLFSVAGSRFQAEPRTTKILMAGLSLFNFKLSQIYPGVGEQRFNKCAKPDCSNFGKALTDRAIRKSM
jgi:hypothetical protein